MTTTVSSNLYVAAARLGPTTQGGLYRRTASRSGWERLTDGLAEEHVYAVTVHPKAPATVYAGAKGGLYRSTDRGDHWHRTALPMEAGEVWAVCMHPADPRIMYAGTSPTGVWRSDDAGARWRRLPGAAQPDRVKMEFACRVMRFAVDPSQPDAVYAALEVGGAIRSLDGGEHWDDCCAGLLRLAERPHLKSQIQSDTDTEGMLDAHALAVSAASPGTVFLAVRMGLFRSADRGAGWEDMEVGRFSPLTYARDVRVSPQDPRVLYACLSPASRSHDGSLYRSADLGETWARFDRGVKADATMMALALDPRDPAQVHSVSRCGQVFSTGDAGTTWREERLPAAVQDVYAIACG